MDILKNVLKMDLVHNCYENAHNRNIDDTNGFENRVNTKLTWKEKIQNFNVVCHSILIYHRYVLDHINVSSSVYCTHTLTFQMCLLDILSFNINIS
jgi:hypothetical protein